MTVVNSTVVHPVVSSSMYTCRTPIRSALGMRIWTWHGMASALVCVFYLDSWGRVVLRDTREGEWRLGRMQG
jgi:hypothetical protein